MEPRPISRSIAISSANRVRMLASSSSSLPPACSAAAPHREQNVDAAGTIAPQRRHLRLAISDITQGHDVGADIGLERHPVGPTPRSKFGVPAPLTPASTTANAHPLGGPAIPKTRAKLTANGFSSQ